MSTFTTTLRQQGNNVGIEIPDAVVAELGGKRVPVRITLSGPAGDYTYTSTTAVMGGRNLVGLNSEHRAASGYGGGDVVEVTMVRDETPRTVEVPDELAAAFADDPALAAAWERLAPSHKKEHARSITDAKAAETRARRVEKTLARLRGD